MNETALKAKLLQRLSDHFVIQSEVDGINLVDGSQVRIDFMFYPKPHLIATGFEENWFGVEVKYIAPPREHNKMNKLAWQSVTYSQSEFSVSPDINVRPMFVLMYIDDKRELPDPVWRTLIHFVQFGNVGRLVFQKNNDWVIVFGGGVYYSYTKHRKGRGRNNVGRKRYTGSVR